MRLKGRQLRFLLATLMAWSGLRAALLMWPLATVPSAVMHALAISGRANAATLRPVPRPPAAAPDRIAASGTAIPPVRDPAQHGVSVERISATADLAKRHPSFTAVRAAADQPIIAVPAPVAPRGTSRWAGEGALFVRPGSGSAALAAGGQLGGSQVYARLTYRLNPDKPIRFAAAARVYRPLASKGAEAAVGLDWHPLPSVPLRISVERRVGLDRLGRDAWSAYAAGGFYAGHLPLGAEADGYAQAGVVGIERRDGFVDGALRIGHRVATGPDKLVMGAGLWGAAQPGVSRMDFGPRASLTVPVARHSLVFALEDRMRIAGHARPGSGVAFTLAAAF